MLREEQNNKFIIVSKNIEKGKAELPYVRRSKLILSTNLNLSRFIKKL